MGEKVIFLTLEIASKNFYGNVVLVVIFPLAFLLFYEIN